MYFSARHVNCSLVFFFSSRRRHTRSLRDWSSDVCSSDLCDGTAEGVGLPHPLMRLLAENSCRAEANRVRVHNKYSVRRILLGGVGTLAVIWSGCFAVAQSASPEMLLHPPAESWPGYHGDYSGRRHTSLTQITPENVKNLSLAWAFQTDQTTPIKSSPLVVDGILYFTVPDHIWAVDARSGHQIWHYTYPPNKGL